ncbi:hypothetical protein D3C79_942620 [compost metagenome]
MIATDQVQHHVHGGRSAGACKAVLVEGEQARADADSRESFLHGGQEFPMHAALVAVEQPGFGERPAAGAHTSQPSGLTRQGLQPGNVLAGNHVLDSNTTAHDYSVRHQWIFP